MGKSNLIKQLEIDSMARNFLQNYHLKVAIGYAIENEASEEVFKEIRMKCIERKQMVFLKKLILMQVNELDREETEKLLEIYKQDPRVKKFLKLKMEQTVA